MDEAWGWVGGGVGVQVPNSGDAVLPSVMATLDMLNATAYNIDN